MKTRSMIGQLVLAGLAWAGCFCGAARGDVWGDWTYEVDAGAATLTGWAGTGPMVTIPASVGDGTGVPVTGLGDELFAGRTDVTEVRVEAALTSVGTDVFAGCANLTRAVIDAATVPDSFLSGVTTLAKLELEDGLASIGYAFSGCTALGSVEIPDSVTFLHSGAFYGCTGITNLVIGDGITDSCGKLNGIGSGLERLVIGGGMKNVGCGMFGGQANLQELVLREGVEVIWQGTFNGAGISELRLPDSLERLDGGSLMGLPNLTNIVWGTGIREMSSGVFGACTALTDVTIPASVTNLSAGVFNGCTGLTNLTVNAQIETFSGVFYGCTNMERVALGDGVGGLGDMAFAGCGQLTDVELGTNVTSIGEGAFSNCTALAVLALPDSADSVGVNAFAGCTALAELSVPESWYGTDKLAGAGVPPSCVVLYGDLPAIRTTTLATAVAEMGYEATLEAAGGTGPYTWSAPEGWFAEMSGENTFAETGTAQGWQAEASTWDLELPFAFPFFGKTYTQAKVSSQGYIAFGTNELPNTLYDEAPVIAAMWSGLGTESGDIYVDSGADWVTVRWQASYFWNAPANFSATLCADGRIVLKYGYGNEDGGQIGVAAGDGTVVVSAMNYAYGMGNAADIVFTPGWGTPLPGWLELTEGGVLRGMTDAAGEYSFSVMATDAAGATAQRDLTLAVSDERWIVQAGSEGRGRIVPSRVVATNGMTVTITADGDGREFSGWSWSPQVGATSTGTTWTWTVPEGSGLVELTAMFQSRDYFVDAAAGNDEGAGSEQTPLATLQTAIDRAGDGETVWVAPGTYGAIHTDDRFVRIVATEGPENTIIDVTGTTNRCALLLVPNTEYSDCSQNGCLPVQTNTVLEGFTLRGADVGSYETGGAVFGGTLVNCTVTGNAAGYGAGQAFGVAEGCRFSDNTAASGGGGMFGGIARNCHFERNSALDGCGGGGYELASATGCEATGNSAQYGGGFANCDEITDCVVASNTAAYNGGGLYYCTTVTGTEIRGNRSGEEGNWVYGGGLYSATLVSNCVVAGNVAEGYSAYGGGIAGGSGDILIVDCEIRGNRAEGEYSQGGGIYSDAWGNGAQAGRCTIAENAAVSRDNYNGGCGGGAYGVVLWECHVTDNLASGTGYAEGGGAYGKFALQCVFTGNRAEASFHGGNARGGAANSMDLSSCTVSNNEARVGGGMYFGTAKDTLVTHNRATQQGGGTCYSTLTNCIVAHNRAPVDGGCNEISGWNNTVALNESDCQKTLLVWGANNLLVWGETIGGRMQPIVVEMPTSTQQTPGSVYVGYDPDTWESLYGTPVYGFKPLPMADPWHGDYRLVAGSEAIDAGTEGWDGTLFYDMATAPRVRGAGPDLGALESDGGVEALIITVLTEGSGKTDILYGNVAEGGSVTATAQGEGRPFLGWKVDGAIVSTNRTYTWENVTQSGMLTAVFGPGDIWVDAANGNDANDGSEDSPLKTLQAAVGLACAGDTVRAKPGTYAPFMAAGKTIDIVGEAGAEETVIDGRWARRCATMDDGMCLRGFTLRRGSAFDEALDAKNGAACLGGRLEDCIVDECGAWSDGWGYSGDYNVLKGVELERCIVRNCQVDGTLYYNGRGTNRNTLVTGNTVQNLWGWGSSVNENLTLVDNAVSSSVLSGGTWRNCIVWGNGEAESYDWEGGWMCMEGAEARDGDGEEGPVWTDNPLFVSAEQGDFRLTTYSPYLDQGNAAWLENGATDLAGRPRLDGAGLDLGCYEGGIDACTVTFELGEGLVQLDHRPLSAIIEKGTDAPAPDVAAVSGWRFDGWTPGLEGVMEDTAFVAESAAALSDWAAAIHRGDVESDETWAAGTVHVVEGTVWVRAGTTLTIEAGAVVKFAPGAKLLQDGGMVVSQGAIFTHLYDDEVGGDTLDDGAARVPETGDYEVEVGLEGEGTEYRHLGPAEETTPDGANAPDVTVWGPEKVHVLPSGYTVAFRKTLRLQAGTIVKVGDGQQLLVKGTLLAEGTATKPVVITSMHDDKHGGDTDGDEGVREPAAGDWDRIDVTGKATFNHCSVLYGSGTAEFGGIEAWGGRVTFENGEIAHMEYDCVNAHNSGKVTARNSAFWDASLGFGYYGGTNVQAYNCVFQSLSTAIRSSGKQFSNCAFVDCVQFTTQGGELSQFDHCLFWNPEGYGEQSFAQVGENGNIWGDPKFVDAANGDFHVQEGSACIDAGDGTVAPETDRFGNVRVTLTGDAATGVANADGAVADIGLHEYSGRYSTGSDVDVAVTEVRVAEPASGNLAPGDEATVVWRLSSEGEAAYEGGWTDRVKLAGTKGRGVVLGELSSAGRIEPGTSKLYWGTFTVPLLMDGEWRLAVDANIDRGVPEGANMENNAFVSTNTVLVANPAVAASGGMVSLAAGETKLVRLTGELEEEDALTVAVSDGTGPVAARAANGSVPTESLHWKSVATAGGGWLIAVGKVRDADETYLLLANEGTEPAEATLGREPGGAVMHATGLDRTEVTAGPAVGVSLLGVGLGRATTLELLKDGSVAAEGTGLVVMAGKVSAVFDLGGIAESGDYEVRATDAQGLSATSSVALRVAVVPEAKGDLDFWLDAPESVRDGRVYKGYVCYRNTGNADMQAPVFEVRDATGSTTVARRPRGPFEPDGCLLTGRGSGSPSTILRAGDTGQVPFWFRVMGGYDLHVRWIPEDAAQTGKWLEKEAAREAEMAARFEAAMEKFDEWTATVGAKAEAWASSNAIPVPEVVRGSVSGRVTDAATGEPVAGATVRLKDDVGQDDGVEGETSGDGTFALDDVRPLGDYWLAVEGWSVVDGAALAVTGAVEGVEVEVRRLTRVTGTVTAGGAPVSEVAVGAQDEEGERLLCETDADGAFDLGWLGDGTWTVRTGNAEGYAGAWETLEIAGEGAVELALELVPGVRWEGRAVDAESGAGVEDLTLVICAPDGSIEQYQTTGANGSFVFPGAPTGTLSVACLGVDWQVGNGTADITPVAAGDGTATGDVELAKKPLLAVFPPAGPAPLAVAFRTTMAADKYAPTAWAWDFDGDGTTDSVEESPVWVFSQPGTYGATLTMTCEDGTTVTASLDDAVTVREKLPTIYQPGVVVLLEGDAAKSADWEFAGWDEDAGILQVRPLAATPAALPAAGMQFLFRIGDDIQLGMKTATAVSGPDGENVWTLETEDAAVTDIFYQLDWSVCTVDAESGAAEPAGRRAGRRDGGTLYEFGDDFHGKGGISDTLVDNSHEGNGVKLSIYAGWRFNYAYNGGVRAGVGWEEMYADADLTLDVYGDASFRFNAELTDYHKKFEKSVVVNGIPMSAGLDFSLKANGWMFAEASFRNNTTIHRSMAIKDGKLEHDSNDQYWSPYLSGGYGWGGNVITSVGLTATVQTPFGPVTGLAGIFHEASITTKIMGNTVDGFTELQNAEISRDTKFSMEIKLPLTKKELKEKAKEAVEGYVWRALSPELRKAHQEAEQKFDAASAQMVADLNGNVEQAAALYAEYAAEYDQRIKELKGYRDQFKEQLDEYKQEFDELEAQLQECEDRLKNAEAAWKNAQGVLQKTLERVIREKLGYVNGYAEQWFGVSTRELLDNVPLLQDFMDSGFLQGILPEGADAKTLLRYLKNKDVDVFTLGKTVLKNAAEKGIATAKQKGYEVTENMLRARLQAINEHLVEDAPLLGEVLAGTLSGKLPLTDPGAIIKEMANPVIGIVADYGNGVRQALGSVGTTVLDPVFERAGYNLMQIQTTCASFSPRALSKIVKIEHLDPLGESYEIVKKAGISAAAEYAGVPGLAVMAQNAWNGLNGDKVPLALKDMLDLNPLSWDSSGEMILDDHWKLLMGFPYVDLVQAAEDSDGDGWTNEEEYRGKSLEEESEPEPQGRKAAKGDKPNTAAKNATHPLKPDTDEGGLPDGYEWIWEKNPLDPSDDKDCKGCKDIHTEDPYCVCWQLTDGEPCECRGCPECLPESEKKKRSKQSNDPNEIAGPEGTGEERYVARGQELEYVIYFENKSDAEAPAQEIRVETQLDPGLDWSTFAAGAVQVGSTWDEGLAGKRNWTSEVALAEGTYRLQSSVACDAATGRVVWYLRVVDPEGFNGWPADPYAGILPPNDPETHCGEGSLTFRVTVREDAVAGSVVRSSATIVFDYNEPIETDPSWWNTVAETMHDVTFVNENGRVLKTATKYAHGTAAADIVQPENPKKAVTEEYKFAFAGWSPALADVTEDATYTATYTRSLRSFPVRFTWHGGESEAEYEYGTAAGDVVVPEDPAGYVENGVIYTFRGWEPAEVAEVTGAATYRAVYDESAAVAQVVGGAVYPSLAGAIAAAPAGGTVVLLADDGVSFAGGGVVIDKDLVIDGGGFTVRGVSNANLHNVTAGAVAPDVEFDGVEGSNVRGFFVKGGNVTFTNLVLTEFGDADYVNKFGYTPIQTAGGYDGTLTIADVDIDKFNRTAICIRGGTFLISGGSIVANAENRDVETLGKDHFQQPVEIRGGTGTIEGVSVSGGDTWGNNGGGAIVAWSGVTVSNASIDFTGVGIWADYAAVTVTGDDTSVVATDKALFVEDGGAIAVAAGDFAGTLAVDAVQGSSIVVDGGTFDAPVPAAFAGAGLAATTVADGSGKYTVRTARTATFDSNGGSAVVPAVVADGEPVAEPDPAPLKEHYSLRAWLLGEADYDFAAAVTADITLVADWVLDRHTVAFLDEDGTPISSAQYDYGTAAADIARPEEPAKTGGAKVYAFAGWLPEVVAVTEDATYWATYRLLGVTAANGVVVPAAWLEANCPGALDENGAVALEGMAANGRDTVWQCYVAGLDPNDAGAVYECVAEVGMGEPDAETGTAEVRGVVLHVVVPPGRVAQLKSAAALTAPVVWTETTAFTNTTGEVKTEAYTDEATGAGIRFYRVLLRLAE